MVNITNSFDQISNEQIVNVLYVQRPAIKRVLLVYSIILTIFGLINMQFFLQSVFVFFLFSYLLLFFLKVNLSLIKITNFVQNMFIVFHVD